MGKFWRWLGRLADGTGLWGPVAGGAAMLTGMTWAATAWEMVYAQGWGAVVFAGVGMTCAVVAVVSMGLIAWRTFRPLPPALAPIESPANVRRLRPEELVGPSDLAALREDLQAARATLDGVASTVMMQGRHLEDLDEVERSRQDLTQRVGVHADDIRQLSLDFLHSLSFVTSQATLLLLDELVRLAPRPLPEDAWSEESRDAALDYLQKVKNPLGGTHRMQMLSSSLELAAHDAEQAIEHAEQPLPGGANPIVFRRWAIAHLQAQAAVEFLKRERARVTHEMVGQRHRLVEIYHRRNPS